MIVAATLGGCLAPGAEPSSPPPSSSASTPATSSPATTVRVRAEPGGVRVRFELAQPASDVAFAQTQVVVREAWTVVTPGVSLVEDHIRSSTEVGAFELWLEPDSEERDRVYPSVTAVGEGFVLYGPALDLVGQPIEAVVESGAGHTVRPDHDPLAGYLYLGPAEDAVGGDGIDLVGAKTVAPWLADLIAREASTSMSHYRRMLEASVPTPTIFVTDDAPGPMVFHGDVSDNSVIFLRFHGEQWASSDDAAARGVAKFVRHELFHLWNGDNAAGTPPWIHEGGAEYAALVSAVQAGVLSQGEGVERVSGHLTSCRRALGEAPIDELSTKGSGLYDCGVAVHWLADVEARQASGGARHTFSVWNELLAAGGRHNGYTESDFRAATGPHVAAFLDAPDGQRWSVLGAQASSLGFEVSDRASDDDLRAAVLRHLLSGVCTGGIGWWTRADHVRLDTGQRCGPLSGEPEVVSVQGRALFGEAALAFSAVVERCEAGRAVTVTTRAGSDLEVRCQGTPPPPITFNLERAPALAISSSPSSPSAR